MSPPTTQYIAGFFDGEGSVYITRIRRKGRSDLYRLQVAFYNTNRQVLEAIQGIYGGYINGNGNKPRSGHKVCYVLLLTSLRAMRVLKDLRPYTLVKTAQIDVAFEFDREIRAPRMERYTRSWDSERATVAWSHQPDILARLEQLRLKIHNLKGTTQGLKQWKAA